VARAARTLGSGEATDAVEPVPTINGCPREPRLRGVAWAREDARPPEAARCQRWDTVTPSPVLAWVLDIAQPSCYSPPHIQ
jgi:hypothetical protein